MYAFAIVDKDGILLARDPQGVQPLYLGLTGQQIVFGSEIKAVMPYADKIMEFPPGFVYTTKGGGRPFRRVTEQKVESTDPEEIAQELLSRITNAVASRMVSDVPVGVLLSGGLGSSIIASIANQFSPNIKTFAVGMEGSPDLEAARKIAEHIGTDHHERIFTFEEALKILPKVIYHLESYDATIVRSAIANYFGAELAAEHVKVALSGEGADELFAGYPYLTGVHGKRLADELDEIARALHFTSLQRCDRMCTAHGLEVRVPYLDDLQVAEYAMAIPVQFKVEPRRNIDKWILRKSVEGLLPDETVWRKKERTTNGTGIGKMLSDWAESQIGEDLYKRVAERHKAFGIRNREELAYFLMFRRKFPAEKVWPLIGRSRRV
jgi:asparagine synthase (glutamine-hydrolysing)